MADVSKIKLSGTTYNIKDASAITNITRSGTTFTATKRDGTTFTFTQQDNNTTYSANNGVGLSGTTFYNSGVRSITTGSSNGTISVNTNGTAADVAVKGLGSAAYTASTAYAAASHSHSYLPLSGGTLTGALNLANNTYNKIGDDAQLGDVNQAGKIGIKGINGATGIYFAPYSGSTAQTLSIDGAGTMTISGTLNVETTIKQNGTAVSLNGHTHNYAGSSSAGGAATSALTCTGNSATATKLQTARTIFGKSFDGSGNVAGQPLVYGTYTATAASRYANGGIQVRENGLVGNAQSDMAYAPAIGWHWSGRIAATLLFHSDGNFYLRKQNFTDRASLDANIIGNVSGSSGSCTGTAAAANVLNSNTRMDYGWNGVNYFNISAANQSAAKVNDTPSSSATWWHIMRYNHGNSTGYYTDLAIPFNANGLYWKRVTGGTLQNSGTNGGWIQVLDRLNTTTTSIGSASGWSAGSVPSLSYTSRSIPNVTSVGSRTSVNVTVTNGVLALPATIISAVTVPTLGTAIAADDITAWSAGSVPSLTVTSVSNVLKST